MNDNLQTRRLIRWNRFWLAVVALYSLVGGFNYLERLIISNAGQLQVRLTNGGATNGEGELVISSVGGPFIVTHLVIGSDTADIAIGAIAQLPRPLFIRPKSASFIAESQFSNLSWFDAGGRKVASPKFDVPVQVLFYEMQQVATGN